MKYKIGMRIPRYIGTMGIERVAEWSAQIGLDVLDVSALTPEVKQACDRFELEIGTVDTIEVGKLLSADEQKRESAVALVKNQISEVAGLGGKRMFMCLHPEDRTQSRSKSFDIFKETFPVLIAHAEKEGVYMAIEGFPGGAPHYATIGCTPEMWREMFKAVPSPHFGLNYDPSHLVRLGIDYLRALDEFGERVVHCHGKDTEILPELLYEFGTLPATFGAKYKFSEGSWRYTIPGHGEVNWGKVGSRLERFGYEGAVCIELEDHRFEGSLEAEQQGIIEAYRHLFKFL